MLTGSTQPERVPDLMADVQDTSRHDAPAWFPGMDPSSVRVELQASWVRPRCVIHRVRVTDGVRQENVVVKVRRQGPATAAEATSRPILAGVLTEPPAVMAEHEMDGLSLIAAAVPAGDDRFSVVRPLALLPRHAALVMDHVDAPTMRSVLMASSRPRRGPRDPRLDRALERSGALLRGYHGQTPAHPARTRQRDRAELVALVHEFTGHLQRRTGDHDFFARLAPAVTDRVEAAFDEQLTVTVGHGDFVVRNLFVSSGGRVSLIDPMPRWLVPRYEDMARFLVGMRLLGLQVATAGLAFGARDLDRYEASFLNGYFDGEPIPAEQVRAYQLLVLMDKWCTTVGREPRGAWRRQLRRPLRSAVHRYYRAEAQRLLTGPGRTPGLTFS